MLNFLATSPGCFILFLLGRKTEKLNMHMQQDWDKMVLTGLSRSSGLVLHTNEQNFQKLLREIYCYDFYKKNTMHGSSYASLNMEYRVRYILE